MLQDYIEVGKSELEIALQTLAESTARMVNMHEEEWEPITRGSWGSVSLTSGPKTALNHHEAGSRRIEKG